MQKNYTFEQLKDIYSSKNKDCGNGKLGKIFLPAKIQKIPFILKKEIKKKVKLKRGKIVNASIPIEESIMIEQYKPDRILNIKCNNYKCASCRPVLKNKLHQNIQREVYIWHIDKHLIITFPGKPYRNKVSYDKSYAIINQEINKVMHRIYYEIEKIKQGKITRSKEPLLHDNQSLPEYDFAYIILPRAQTNPIENNPIGFCHLHTLINYPINKHWIEEKIIKNNYKLGYTFIRENQNVADYLCKDFYDDAEWIIPYNIKHYRTSRNITINIENEPIYENKYIDGEISVRHLEEKLSLENKVYHIFGKGIVTKHTNILPFEEYLKEFYDKVKEIDKIYTKEVKVNENGIQEIYRTKNNMFIKNAGN